MICQLIARYPCNDIVILWCVQHFTVSRTLQCPELYCVQHITVSNTLLCQAKYCVHTYPKDLLSTFPISTCCGRIMCLRSTSVVFHFALLPIVLSFFFLNHFYLPHWYSRILFVLAIFTKVRTLSLRFHKILIS